MKVADGVDAHDAATVGQLESAISQVQSVGSNLELQLIRQQPQVMH